MTIQQRWYIVTLDAERHFARAAELCSITQPGLTIQLKNLEEEIGIKIFDRSKVFGEIFSRCPFTLWKD